MTEKSAEGWLLNGSSGSTAQGSVPREPGDERGCMVIADSSVWIEYFRSGVSPVQSILQSLLEQDEVLMTGVVLSEVLRGVRSDREYRLLAELMGELPYAEATKETWMNCGNIARQLRTEGVTVHMEDALIATLAIEGGHEVYTRDSDFDRIPGVRLYRPGRLGS